MRECAVHSRPGYVLETGEIVLQGLREELFENKEIQRAYLGKIAGNGEMATSDSLKKGGDISQQASIKIKFKVLTSGAWFCIYNQHVLQHKLRWGGYYEEGILIPLIALAEYLYGASQVQLSQLRLAVFLIYLVLQATLAHRQNM